MGSIISSYIFPHPPIIVPEVGKGGEKEALQTVKAIERAAGEIRDEKPTTIIVTTPHGAVFGDYIYISLFDKLTGDFSKFGSRGVRFEFENNIDLAERIIKEANRQNILCGGMDEELIKEYNVSKELDHGATVPLYFIKKLYSNFKLVHISTAFMPFEQLYKFGMCISRAVRESEERVVFIASGDLSHRLSDESPYGYNEHGPAFDQMFVKSIKELDIERLLGADEDFCDEAGECGLRSFLIMFGALDGYKLKSEVYSYEGPFGIGYSVARFDVGEQDTDRKVLEKVKENYLRMMEEVRNNESPYVALAREALETYVKGDRLIKVPEGLPEEMTRDRAGTFVSIKKRGQLRGCIGTTGPAMDSIAEEIIQNAISSGTRDPRFQPVEADELDELVYSVDVLGEPEPIKSIDELDVVKYGVIVKSGIRSGLLLPNLEGVNTPEEQVSITLQKAGIRSGEKYTMERFEVVRYK
ncbi:MAG: AmmeMemoRadiSam system protein A [Clostridia bacterium]|nr:AmmeMemoRadiSam system protein A [Clostridia bacterium]